MERANPDAAKGEVTNLLRAGWKPLTANQKAKYVDLAKEDKVQTLSLLSLWKSAICKEHCCMILPSTVGACTQERYDKEMEDYIDAQLASIPDDDTNDDAEPPAQPSSDELASACHTIVMENDMYTISPRAIQHRLGGYIVVSLRNLGQ